MYHRVSTEGGKPFGAEAFLLKLRKSALQWNRIKYAEIVPQWYFRGQRNSSWKLVPSAWRDRPFKNARFSFLPEFGMRKIRFVSDRKNAEGRFSPNDSEFHNALEMELKNEFRALATFQRFAAESGFVLPQFPRILGSPSESRSTVRHPDINWHLDKHYENWEVLLPLIGISQHSGIPTRFLDVTLHPWKACHFAAHSWENHEPKDIAVWALRARKGLSVHRPIVAENQRILAQSGALLLNHEAEYYFLEKGRWPTIPIEEAEVMEVDWEDIASGSVNPSTLQFVLGKDHVPELIELLHREGVTEATLMWSLEGVANTLKRRWQLGKPY